MKNLILAILNFIFGAYCLLQMTKLGLFAAGFSSAAALVCLLKYFQQSTDHLVICKRGF